MFLFWRGKEAKTLVCPQNKNGDKISKKFMVSFYFLGGINTIPIRDVWGKKTKITFGFYQRVAAKNNVKVFYLLILPCGFTKGPQNHKPKPPCLNKYEEKKKKKNPL